MASQRPTKLKFPLLLKGLVAAALLTLFLSSTYHRLLSWAVKLGRDLLLELPRLWDGAAFFPLLLRGRVELSVNLIELFDLLVPSFHPVRVKIGSDGFAEMLVVVGPSDLGCC